MHYTIEKVNSFLKEKTGTPQKRGRRAKKIAITVPDRLSSCIKLGSQKAADLYEILYEIIEKTYKENIRILR